jgi:hypothetical protein
VGCQGDGGRVDGRGYASTELSSLPALMFLDLGCCCHEVTAAGVQALRSTPPQACTSSSESSAASSSPLRASPRHLCIASVTLSSVQRRVDASQ